MSIFILHKISQIRNKILAIYILHSFVFFPYQNKKINIKDRFYFFQEDLCGQRGLMAGSEQQTFQIAVPRKLRAQYDRVLMPLTQPQVNP